ncbi:MAG: AAA family ATPase, partial [Candidatus Heimdallarchaeota archaeon]|nr:AAA family ATPase [Candidatus Heimdallarchaeota archaeon]
MSYTFRPAVREQTPVIIGLAGPSKSGKTYSALRLATGMAKGGKIAMINTEGRRGHQYADKFKYDAADLSEPFTMKSYEEAIKDAAKIKPAVLIIDSMSHAHEGIGGMLDQHEAELDRLSKGGNYEKRQKLTWAAWIRVKADEATMINTMLQQNFHIILAFRAKEKIKIIKGKEPKDLGWRPIASDRIHFETAVTLILPPNSKGKPDLTEQGSELREPFDSMIKAVQIDEKLGQQIAE